MKKIISIFVLAALVIGGTMNVSAQKRENDFSIQLGGLLPLHSFSASPAYCLPGTNNLGNTGAAMFGANLGFKYNHRFDIGLGVFASADLMWNALNKDIRTMYDNVSCTKPMYVNVPIFVGVSYISDFSDVVDVWAEAGVGADLFFKTAEGWNNNLLKYDMNTAFASEVGVGVCFIDLISIGVHYYWLGNQRVKVNGITYDETYITPHKIKTGMLAFKLGFHF